MPMARRPTPGRRATEDDETPGRRLAQRRPHAGAVSDVRCHRDRARDRAAPVRTLAAVAPSATVRRPRPQPLTRAAPALAPLPVDGLAFDARRRRSPRGESGPPRSRCRSRRARESPRSASPSASTGGTGRRPRAARARPAVHRAARRRRRRGAGPARGGRPRRAGLGAPLPAAPSTRRPERLPCSGPGGARPVSPASPAPSVGSRLAAAERAPRRRGPRRRRCHRGRRRRGAPAAGRFRSRQRPGATMPRSGTPPVGASRAAAASARTAGRAARPTVARVRRPDPPHGRRPAPATRRDRAAGRVRFARRPDRRTPRSGSRAGAPSPVAGAMGITGDTLPATVTSLPASPRTGAPIPVQLSTDRRGGPLQASLPPAANAPGAREIVFPPRDSDGGGPRVVAGAAPAASGPAARTGRRPSAPSRHRRQLTGSPRTLARPVTAAPVRLPPRRSAPRRRP